jgi:hypothetical protein
LTSLAEIYAIRVRELSDAAATLGRRIAAGEEIKNSVIEILRRRALAEQASENLLNALELPKSRISVA